MTPRRARESQPCDEAEQALEVLPCLPGRRLEPADDPPDFFQVGPVTTGQKTDVANVFGLYKIGRTWPTWIAYGVGIDSLSDGLPEVENEVVI